MAHIEQQAPQHVLPRLGPEVGAPDFVQRTLARAVEELPQILVEVGVELLHQQLAHDLG